MNVPEPSKPFSLRTVTLIFGSLVLMAALDFSTGQELAFSCAYLVPVSLTAWWFSRRWLVAMSILTGITAYCVDILDGYEFSHPGIGYWNAFTSFVISMVTGHVLLRLKKTLNERKAVNKELREALANLEASTAEIRKLQDGLQVVCAWTKRVKVGDQWMTPDELLSTQLHLRITHGVSPEAFREISQELFADVEAEMPKPTAKKMQSRE